METVLLCSALAGIVLSVLSEKTYLLSPMLQFSVFFVIFIVPNIDNLNATYSIAVTLGFIAFAFSYTYFCGIHNKIKYAAPGDAFIINKCLSLRMLLLLILIISAAQLYFQLKISGIDLDTFFACPICETSLFGKKDVALSAALYISFGSLIYILIYRRLFYSKSYLEALVLGCFNAIYYLSSLGTGRVVILTSFAMPFIFAMSITGMLANKKAQSLLVLVVMIILFPLLYILNIIRHGILDFDLSPEQLLVSFSSDLNPGYNLGLLIDYIDVNGPDYGYFLFSPFLPYFARFLLFSTLLVHFEISFSFVPL